MQDIVEPVVGSILLLFLSRVEARQFELFTQRLQSVKSYACSVKVTVTKETKVSPISKSHHALTQYIACNSVRTHGASKQVGILERAFRIF